MAPKGTPIDPTVPEVTWENLKTTCLRVAKEPLNFYLELHKGECGLQPIYEPFGHRDDVPLEVWWYPLFIAQGFKEKFAANKMSVDTNWPDESAAEVYRECKPFLDHKERINKAAYDQRTSRHEYIVEMELRQKKSNG